MFGKRITDEDTIKLYKKEIKELNKFIEKLQIENDRMRRHIAETDEYRQEFLNGIEKNKELSSRYKDGLEELRHIKELYTKELDNIIADMRQTP